MRHQGPPDSNEFDELERRFFDAAPPEVAAAPPEAMSFDDLDEGRDAHLPTRLRRPDRRKVRRPTTGTAKVSAKPSTKTSTKTAATSPRRFEPTRVFAAVVGRVVVAALRALAGASRAAGERVRRWSGGRVTFARRALAVGVPLVRRLVEQRKRAIVTAARVTLPKVRGAAQRLLDQLPGERLDGKTLAATIALVIVVGISVGVFAQRPAVSAQRAYPVEVPVDVPSDVVAPAP